MFRLPLLALAQFGGLVLLAAAACLLALAVVRETLCGWNPGENRLPRDERPEGPLAPGISLGTRALGAAFRMGRPRTASPKNAIASDEESATWLAAGHVTVVLHGVNDDGKDWSLRIKNSLTEGRPASRPQEVYLLRWTQPDGTKPSLSHARSTLRGLEDRRPDDPETEAAYQIGVAERLRDFLRGARALQEEYGVKGKINVLAHSQGTLIALKALDLGADADDVVFLGSPLCYTGERQDDVLGALPRVRGVLYNYYTPSDVAVRFMGGSLYWEPRGWPEKDFPEGKVIQTKLDVQGHTGYCTTEAVRVNYADKLGVGAGEEYRMPAGKAKEFMARWDGLVKTAKLIDPE